MRSANWRWNTSTVKDGARPPTQRVIATGLRYDDDDGDEVEWWRNNEVNGEVRQRTWGHLDLYGVAHCIRARAGP